MGMLPQFTLASNERRGYHPRNECADEIAQEIEPGIGDGGGESCLEEGLEIELKHFIGDAQRHDQEKTE